MPACSQTGKLSEARHQERKPDMQNDWTKPAALAIPEGGFFPDKVEQGRYGPIYPKTPACYGFSILARIKPGTKQNFYAYAKRIEKGVAETPDGLAVLRLHYLRWGLFDIGKDTYFMYQGIFDTDFDKYTEDAVALFSKYGLNTVIEILESFSEALKHSKTAFIMVIRLTERPS